MKNRRFSTMLVGTLAGAALLLPWLAHSHCDTMDGPVVQDARTALDKKDPTPVLKWVKPDGEAEVKAAFAKTLAVRAQSPAARELADQFFFETLVRVHRAGEGAPFTGLKPAGTPLEPGIAAADQALEHGSVEKAVKLVTDDAAAGIRKHFAEAREKQRHAAESVQAGREFVAAYVDYIHYVEGLHQAAQGAGAHSEAQAVTEAHSEPHAHH
ncbi:MAG TPA: DUF6448 family protein [Bacillota bacterium]|nr:DUF6448 family protein [Bacillota bacterium]